LLGGVSFSARLLRDASPFGSEIPETVRALPLHLAGCLGQRAQGREGERATDRDPADTTGGELAYRRPTAHQQHVDRPIDRPHKGLHVIDVGEPGRVKHVGPGCLVALQTSNGVRQLGSSVKVILCPSREDESTRRGLDGSRDALDRQFKLIDGLSAEVLYRAPG